MGGIGSGGMRLGSGRKSKDGRLLHLHGGKDRLHRGKPVELPPSAPVDPPKGLTEAQMRVWQELAPHAVAAHTLTPGTAGSFADLCRAIVTRDAMLAKIEEDGWTFIKVSVDGAGVEHQELKKHPLTSDQRGWEQRVEAGRARFRLAPMGKELVPTAKPEDPFAEFDGEMAQ